MKVPTTVQYDLQDTMQAKVGIVRNQGDIDQAVEDVLPRSAIAPRKSRRPATASTTPAGTPPSTCRTCWSSPKPSPAARRSARRAAARHFREDHPEGKDEEWAKVNLVIRKGADGSMQLSREPLVPMTDEHRQIIEENK